MKVLIIEDESFSAKRLVKMLLELRPEYQVLDTLDSIESGIRWLRENPAPDLIFSDVRVADGLSFEIFKQLGTSSPIIFTTAFDQYALQAFKTNSVDYLLKPVDKEALQASLSKFEAQNRSRHFPHKNRAPVPSTIAEQERVFMFIDLNNSTALAEQMGPTAYSKFLTSYFDVLLTNMNGYDAEIYQVVGDEIVLTWPVETLGDMRIPFQLHYKLEEAIALNRSHFEHQYQATPAFTSSLHKGPVAMTYVSDHLKDLAYHGDVLNTTARMLEHAKGRQVKLVVSGEFTQGLEQADPFVLRSLGPIRARGKKNILELFSVELPPGITPADSDLLIPWTKEV